MSLNSVLSDIRTADKSAVKLLAVRIKNISCEHSEHNLEKVKTVKDLMQVVLSHGYELPADHNTAYDVSARAWRHGDAKVGDSFYKTYSEVRVLMVELEEGKDSKKLLSTYKELEQKYKELHDVNKKMLRLEAENAGQKPSYIA